MNNKHNRRIYRFYAPLYDFFFKTASNRPRRQAIRMLCLQPGERLLIPGIGTGLDLLYLPEDVFITGVDYSPEMLEQAYTKINERNVVLIEMDAQNLDLPDTGFDAVLFTLALSVIPDGRAAFGEAWRLLRPGGRIVIFDKFLPEKGELTLWRYILGCILSAIGTDPNRRLSDIIARVPGLVIQQNKPSLFRGQYRLLRITKEEKKQ